VSTKRYKGAVETVEHAMMAHMVVTVACTVCPPLVDDVSVAHL
jgi:hypothetical protein